MKLKLDENLGSRAEALFRTADHDVETVRSEGLSGAPDQTIYEECCTEGRCLVTLDLDFADPLRFSARRCGGIVILRERGRMTAGQLETLIGQCLHGLQTIPMERDLWIVEPTRIRIHQQEED